MRAMLLTAGVGRRMMPLTLSQPKPTIPVLGRPLVMQTLHWLHGEGVGEAVLNLHHLPDSIKSVLGNGTNPGLPSVRYSHEEVILGTGGGIRQAGNYLGGDGPIVICNSDFLSDIDLSAAVDAHLASDHLSTLVLTRWRETYTPVSCDGEGRVTRLGGEPRVSSPSETPWLFTGCHIMDEEVIERIPADRPSCIVRDVYRQLVTEGRVGSYVHDGFWWEFGSPELYLEGCLRLMDLPSDELQRISEDHDSVRKLGGATVAVGPGATVAEGVRFIGRAALGYSSYVSPDARVEDSVVMPEAWIGPGCRLERSVIGQGVELPAGWRSDNELICLDPDPSLDLPPSTRRQGGLLVYSFSPAGTE